MRRVEAPQVAVSNHRDQSGLRSLASLEKPLREVRARTRFWDRDVNRACPGVQGGAGGDTRCVGREARGLVWSHWAPHTASASADNNALTTCRSSERTTSRDGLEQRPAKKASRANNMRNKHRRAPERIQVRTRELSRKTTQRPHPQQPTSQPPHGHTTTQNTTDRKCVSG